MNEKELKILESAFLDRVNFKIAVINKFCVDEDQSFLPPVKLDKELKAIKKLMIKDIKNEVKEVNLVVPSYREGGKTFVLGDEIIFQIRERADKITKKYYDRMGYESYFISTFLESMRKVEESNSVRRFIRRGAVRINRVMERLKSKGAFAINRVIELLKGGKND